MLANASYNGTGLRWMEARVDQSLVCKSILIFIFLKISKFYMTWAEWLCQLGLMLHLNIYCYVMSLHPAVVFYKEVWVRNAVLCISGCLSEPLIDWFSVPLYVCHIQETLIGLSKALWNHVSMLLHVHSMFVCRCYEASICTRAPWCGLAITSWSDHARWEKGICFYNGISRCRWADMTSTYP